MKMNRMSSSMKSFNDTKLCSHKQGLVSPALYLVIHRYVLNTR